MVVTGLWLVNVCKEFFDMCILGLPLFQNVFGSRGLARKFVQETFNGWPIFAKQWKQYIPKLLCRKFNLNWLLFRCALDQVVLFELWPDCKVAQIKWLFHFPWKISFFSGLDRTFFSQQASWISPIFYMFPWSKLGKFPFHCSKILPYTKFPCQLPRFLSFSTHDSYQQNSIFWNHKNHHFGLENVLKSMTTRCGNPGSNGQYYTVGKVTEYGVYI